MNSDELPVVTVKHGRIYASATIIAAIAGGLAAGIIAREQIADLAMRMKVVEADQKGVATKADVERVGARVDELYNLMIERQEAHPSRLRNP